ERRDPVAAPGQAERNATAARLVAELDEAISTAATTLEFARLQLRSDALAELVATLAQARAALTGLATVLAESRDGAAAHGPAGTAVAGHLTAAVDRAEFAQARLAAAHARVEQETRRLGPPPQHCAASPCRVGAPSVLSRQQTATAGGHHGDVIRGPDRRDGATGAGRRGPALVRLDPRTGLLALDDPHPRVRRHRHHRGRRGRRGHRLDPERDRRRVRLVLHGADLRLRRLRAVDGPEPLRGHHAELRRRGARVPAHLLARHALRRGYGYRPRLLGRRRAAAPLRRHTQPGLAYRHRRRPGRPG